MDETSTLEEKKRRYYSKKTHEELVEELIRRDNADDKSTLYQTAKENINEEIVKALQEGILMKVKDPNTVDMLLMKRTSWGTVEPTQILLNIFNNIMMDKMVAELQEGLAATLKEHYLEILKEVMFRTFISGIANNDIFRGAVEKVMREEMQ